MPFNTRSIFITALTVGAIAGSGLASAAQSPRSGSENSGVNPPTATASQRTDFSAHNQFIQGNAAGFPTRTVITIDRVRLSQPGNVSVKATDAYGSALSGNLLGETHLSAGVHHNVKIKLDPKRLQQYGYLETDRTKNALVALDAGSRENPHSRHVIKTILLQNAATDPS